MRPPLTNRGEEDVLKGASPHEREQGRMLSWQEADDDPYDSMKEKLVMNPHDY